MSNIRQGGAFLETSFYLISLFAEEINKMRIVLLSLQNHKLFAAASQVYKTVEQIVLLIHAIFTNIFENSLNFCLKRN
jgi:hypothetical protein